MNFMDDFKIEEIDVNNLRNITKQAQNEQKQDEERKRNEEILLKKLEVEKLLNEAKAVIQTIPFAVKQAAIEGRNEVSVYEINTYRDFERVQYPNNRYEKREQRKNLGVKAALIWDFLEEKGLSPSFYEAHDGVGMKSWLYIKANW